MYLLLRLASRVWRIPSPPYGDRKAAASLVDITSRQRPTILPPILSVTLAKLPNRRAAGPMPGTRWRTVAGARGRPVFHLFQVSLPVVTVFVLPGGEDMAHLYPSSRGSIPLAMYWVWPSYPVPEVCFSSRSSVTFFARATST